MNEYSLSNVCRDAFVVPRLLDSIAEDYVRTLFITIGKRGMTSAIQKLGITENNERESQAALKLLSDVSMFSRYIRSMCYLFILLEQGEQEIKKLTRDELGYLLKRGADLHAIIDNGVTISPKDPIDPLARRPNSTGSITGFSRDDFIKQNVKHPLRVTDYKDRLKTMFVGSESDKANVLVLKQLTKFRKSIDDISQKILQIFVMGVTRKGVRLIWRWLKSKVQIPR